MPMGVILDQHSHYAIEVSIRGRSAEHVGMCVIPSALLRRRCGTLGSGMGPRALLEQLKLTWLCELDRR
jgi:hypothetical protein